MIVTVGTDVRELSEVVLTCELPLAVAEEGASDDVTTEGVCSGTEVGSSVATDEMVDVSVALMPELFSTSVVDPVEGRGKYGMEVGMEISELVKSAVNEDSPKLLLISSGEEGSTVSVG